MPSPLHFVYQCCLLITFANRFDQDQAGQNVWPDLDPICLKLKCIPERIFEKVDFENN